MERPIPLTELESISDLFFFNHGVTLNEEYSLNILNKGYQPQATDIAERMRLKYLSQRGKGKVWRITFEARSQLTTTLRGR